MYLCMNVTTQFTGSSIRNTGDLVMSQEPSRMFNFNSKRWKRMKKKKPKTAGPSPMEKLDREQVLAPGLSFSSTGNLTLWIFSGHLKSKTKAFVPHLQIWRTSSTGSGSHELISSMPVNLDLLSEMSGFDEVYSQIPTSPFIVEAGDCLGVYQPPMVDSQFVMYFREEMALHSIYTKSSVDIPPVVGDTFNVDDGDVTSNHNLVLISAEMSKFEQ